eukprot:gene2496-2799_t
MQSSANDTVIYCRQKLVVTVTVDSGDTISNQDVVFNLNCIGSPNGDCPCPCNYAADASCQCRDLASALSVKLTKGQLFASYPLQYQQTFNFKPYEAIVRPGAGKCKDAPLESSPTCGWYYRAGIKVPDSQGFTCQCDTALIWDTTFGGTKQRTRANLDCDFFSDPLDILIGKYPCSAHCLMMDPHWYGGYSVGEASLQFEITAALTYGNDSIDSSSSTNTSASSETLTLSPSYPWAISSSRTLSAKLLGDLAGYTQLPVLSERVLMIPNPKVGQSSQDIFGNRSEWLLLDRSKISFDGTECDKVGTSFSAFRYQTVGCRRAPQVCLSNQLRDVLEADQARVAAGKVPLYLVTQYTNGLDSQLRAFTGGPLSFALPLNGIRASVVLLEASADSIKFVTNTSPGKIAAARMCQFAEVSCGGFEASASRGYLQALVSNVGVLDASYTLSVTNCSVSVRPVEAQRFSLAAGVNGSVSPFQIFVEDDKGVAQRYCWLVLLDSLGQVTDRRYVEFYTNATSYDPWLSGGLVGNGTGAGLLLLAAKMGWLSSLWGLCSSGGLLSCCGSSRSRDSSRAAAETKQGGRYSSKGGSRYHMDSQHDMFEDDDMHKGRGKAHRHSSSSFDRRPSGRNNRSSSVPFYDDSFDGSGRGTAAGSSSRQSYGQHDRGSISGFATTNPLWDFDPREAAEGEDGSGSSRVSWHAAAVVTSAGLSGKSEKAMRMSSRELAAGQMGNTHLSAYGGDEQYT